MVFLSDEWINLKSNDMRKIVSFVLVLIPCIFVFSCKKGNEGEEAATAQLGVVVKNAQDIYEVPEHQSKTLELAVVADPVSAEAYTITLAADPDLVARYNSAHGTECLMLPSAAYSLASTPVMLPRYSKESTKCELRLKGEGCEAGKTYLLPVVVDGVSGGTNFQAPADKAAYILFKVTESKIEGSGTQASPYLVDNADAFLKIGDLLQDDATVYFKLTADIDFKDFVFTGENSWTPINYAIKDDLKPAARARRIVLDGNNHKLSNFTAGGPLFGTLCGGIQNLTVEKFKIDSDADDGATLVGVAGSSSNPEDFVMKNVTVTDSQVLTLAKRAGSVVSHLRNGSIENCTTACSVEAAQQAGGLVGRIDNGSILNCSASGNVTSGAYYAGGLVGFSGGDVTVKNCHASGSVTSESNYARAGGLIGQFEGPGNATVEKCYATGNVVGTSHFAGGLIGVVNKDDITVNISKCYATGSVTLPTGDNVAHAGGLLGSVCGSGEGTAAPIVNISDCYATGAITVRRYSSGFVGSIYSKPGKLNVINSYTTSDISGIALATHCGEFIGLADKLDAGTKITCSGFIAWSNRDFSIRRVYKQVENKETHELEWAWVWGEGDMIVSVEGNYSGMEDTVSQHAKELGWDTSVWDLSGELPKLK